MTACTGRARRWPTWGAVLSLALVVTASAAGCRRPHVEGALAVDTVLRAWSEKGFDGKAVENVEPDLWSAGACSRGAVGGLDVLLCEYATDEALGVGEKKVFSDWEEEGVATGAVALKSKTLLAITDRAKADPNGRTIALLTKSFREQP